MIGRLRQQLDHKSEEAERLTGKVDVLEQANRDVHEELAHTKAKLRKVETEKALLLRDLEQQNEALEENKKAMAKLEEKIGKQVKTIKVQSDHIAGPKEKDKPFTTPQRLGPQPSAFAQVYSQSPPVYNAANARQPSIYPGTATARQPPATHRQRSAMPPMPPHPSFQPPAVRRQTSGMGLHASYQAPSMQRQSSGMPQQGPYHHGFQEPNMRHPSRAPGTAPAPVDKSFPVQRHPMVQASAPAYSASSTQRPSVVPAQGYNTFGNQHSGMPYGPGQGQFSDPRGMLIPSGSDETLQINMMPEFTPFFNLVEKWALNHANVPDKAKDQAMPSALKAAISHCTNAEFFMKLLSSASTRFFAISKLMNFNIINFAFRPTLMKGFNQQHDDTITDIRSRLLSGIPLHLRRALLVASAETVVDTAKKHGFNEHLERANARKVLEMWQMLEPLFAPGVNRNEAWADLKHIMKEASRIGFLMLSKASIFSLEFPPIGPSAYFNPSNMINRDTTTFTHNPETLGTMPVSVRLAITPIVTETDFMGDAVVPRSLHYANVLLQY